MESGGPGINKSGLTKEEKPRYYRARRGPILQSEVISLLEMAGAGAESTYITVYWTDGNKAESTDAGTLDPIEDATNVSKVSAQFYYDDKSELSLVIGRAVDFWFEATGQVARQRLSALERYWETIPGLSKRSWGALWSSTTQFLPFCLLVLGFIAYESIIYGHYNWAITCGAAFAGLVVSALFDWFSPNGRARFKLIVPVRQSRVKYVVAAFVSIAGIASPIIGLIAYLFPKK